MFVDEVKLKLIAGDGGAGCTSFRREKFVPMGGPDGANGGHGSNIIFKADKSLKTLVDLKYQKIIKGQKGENGKGSNKTGANAEDVIINVPMGTIIYDDDTNLVIKDLIKEDDEVILAKGGRGGRGNKAFATHENTAPKYSENGEKGEVRFLRCELKVLADVGIVGFPSVGKSTFLSVVSSAKPKIAAYHFTTLSPNLGVVKLKSGEFTLADLPGLIEGASEGAGLGDKFLRHADRCRIILHMLDASELEGRDIIDDYQIIRKELEKHSSSLASKKEVVVLSKMDEPNSKENAKKFRDKYSNLDVFEISSYENKGIDELLEFINNTLKTIDDVKPYTEESEEEVYIKFKEEDAYTIKNDNGVWVVSGKEIDRLFSMTKFNEEEGVLRFGRILRSMGVEEKLEKMGAHPGDDVEINGYIFTFKE